MILDFSRFWFNSCSKSSRRLEVQFSNKTTYCFAIVEFGSAVKSVQAFKNKKVLFKVSCV